MSAVMKWIPGAHLEATKDKDAAESYAMKPETAIGEKKSVESLGYMQPQEQLAMIASVVVDMLELQKIVPDLDMEKHVPDFSFGFNHMEKKSLEWWYIQATRRILELNPQYQAMFMNTRLKPAWVDYAGVYIRAEEAKRAQAAEEALPEVYLVDDDEAVAGVEA